MVSRQRSPWQFSIAPRVYCAALTRCRITYVFAW